MVLAHLLPEQVQDLKVVARTEVKRVLLESGKATEASERQLLRSVIAASRPVTSLRHTLPLYACATNLEICHPLEGSVVEVFILSMQYYGSY